jgi:transcriptional regulator with XRE-family HTH domain
VITTPTPYSNWEVWVEVIDHKRLMKFVLLRGVSIRRLAEICDLKSHTYLARVLRGEAKTLNAEAVVRLCHFLELPQDEFFVTRSSGKPGRPSQRKAA